MDQRVGQDLPRTVRKAGSLHLVSPLSNNTKGRVRARMFPEIDWFASSGLQSIFNNKSYELLPGRQGIDVLVLRHVHVEPPCAGHDVPLDRTLQRGGNVLGGGSLIRELPRDPEMFVMKLSAQSVCRQGKARVNFQIAKPTD